MNKKNSLPPYVIKLETDDVLMTKIYHINLLFMLFIFLIYMFIFIITPHDINSENLNQFNLF